MSLSPEPWLRRRLAGAGFRTRFLLAMMLVVAAITTALVLVTRHNAEKAQQADLEANFREQTRSLLALRGERLMAYTDKCRGLSRSVRIHAALEESDVKDLYQLAQDELREVIDTRAPGHSSPHALPPANFFGFVDARGNVQPPPVPAALGSRGIAGLAAFGARLARLDPGQRLPGGQEIGYLFVGDGADGVLDEVIVSPIDDVSRGERLGALVLGFPAENLVPTAADAAGQTPVRVGIWLDEGVYGLDLPPSAIRGLPRELAERRRREPGADHFNASVGGVPSLVFYQPLEVGASFPPAYGVCLYSLVDRQREDGRLRWRIIGGGAAVLAAGFALSFLVSGHLSRPVQRLADGARENLAGRRRAEADLLATNAQLERALSELRATQAQIIQQERLRALGEMASGIAHDFNNALMPILGFSELLLGMPRILDDRQKTTNYLQTINRGARDAGNVVRRLREFYRSREDGERFLPLDLAQLVTQIVDLTQPKWKDQAQARGATVECRARTEPVPPVLGNESDLREALTNLVFNAVDAMPNGGSLTLRTRRIGDRAVVEVSDTGVGMSETVRRRCLEPFFSTKGDNGTGLGLSMVFGIVQRHHGTVEIDSREGHGSTFRICLPAHDAAPTTRPEPVADAPDRRRLRVLAVDDEPPVREILTHLLEGDGHRVVTAGGAREALERFHAEAFDLVITDMAMPGMSGEQLAEALKVLSPRLPIMLLTGFGAFMDIGKTPAINVVASKPITLEELRRGIDAALDSSLAAPVK